MATFLIAVVRILLRLLYRVEVHGELARAERMLIVANHESFLDAVLLTAFLPLRPAFLVHTTIARHWYFRLPLRVVRHLVTDTTKPMAMKSLLSMVEAGEPVVIFPEGRITVTGSLMKVYDGPAFVAAKTGCTVVPIHIDGPIYTPFSRMKGDFARRLFPRITVTIHGGVSIPMPDAPKARERRRLASERMRRLIQETAFYSRRRQTVFESLVRAAGLHGRSRRVLEDINSNFAPVSFRTILKAALALGRLLSGHTSEGEVVGVLMPNANATVYLLFGLSAMRRTPAMLNFTTGAHGVRGACRAAGVRLVVTSRAFVERANLQHLVDNLGELRILYLEDLRRELRLSDKLQIAWAMLNPLRSVPPARPEDPALVMFTSGSEGEPKGVVLSHDSVLANVAQVNAAFPFTRADRFMSALPLFHAFGITAGILLPLLKGCQVVLYPSPLHYRTVPEFVYDHDCTVLFTTNTFLAHYAKVAHPYDFYSVRYLVVGAEKLTDDVQRLCFEKFGLRVLEGYGATECSPVIAVNTPLANRPGTVGEILPGMEHRTVAVAGIENGGVLHVRGANVMLGYLKSDRPGEIEPVASELGPGWYNTGDVVTIADAYITIQGRLKRFAKVAGEMVSLELVERVAAEASAAGLHAAAAYKDGARGEAIFLLTTDPQLDRERLKAAARRVGAPELIVPRRVLRVSEIPVLGNGKRDYPAVTRMAEEALRSSEVKA